MSDIDTSYTENIICPYCGYEDHDSWEQGDGAEDFEGECGECGKTFSASRHITIRYSTQKVEP
jgi:DNA-directed RNA polymerase subunit RPC12/RpoP